MDKILHPPKKPRNDDSPVNTNKLWFPMDSNGFLKESGGHVYPVSSGSIAFWEGTNTYGYGSKLKS